MDATCTIQDSIHVFNLVHKYVSRILGTYHRSERHSGDFCFYLFANSSIISQIIVMASDFVESSIALM